MIALVVNIIILIFFMRDNNNNNQLIRDQGLSHSFDGKSSG